MRRRAVLIQSAESKKSSKKIYTVTEITHQIQALLEESFPEVWVEGEITNLSQSAKGHTYFSLKDETALLKCALFASSGRSVKFRLENGLKVLCYGGISTYPPRGEYQLIVEKIEPQGLGALQLAFEQLKKKLEKEGLFDPKHKKPIPFLPNRIGLVTSLSGKAIRDILKVIGERFTESRVLIRDVRVQGEGAAEEIAEAIRDFNLFGKVDVLLVGRGGGSLEDLWAFNEEVVARAIFASKIPIISCVGHELDFTIADFVADLRAGTPSMAAEMVVPDKAELLETVDDCIHRLRSTLLEKVEFLAERLRAQRKHILFRQPERLFLPKEQHLDDLTQTVSQRMAGVLAEVENRFLLQVGKLETLSPLRVLQRGFSVTYGPGGEVLQETASLSVGAKVTTRLHRGTFVSRVERIE
ncbi:MAG: exodeoxyribonuclease VII large subunit [Candidatus Omnitrophica bacterium]|nr:exodeoxyribonuclease VII large subunit [Candidatus Omnitrophota bacterium]